MLSRKHFVSSLFLLVICTAVLVSNGPAHAASVRNTLILNQTDTQYKPYPVLEILEDPEGRLTIEDIAAAEAAQMFTPHKKTTAPSFGYTSSAFWLRFRVKNESFVEKWILEIGYSPLDRIEIYTPDRDGGFEVRKGGDLLPFESRELRHRNHAFYLPLDHGAEATVYLRFETESSMVLPLTIWHPEAFLGKTQQEYLFLGLYFGIIVVMAFHNLFLFLHVRISHLYYVLYISAIGLFHCSWNGLAYQYLWPDAVRWNNLSLNVFLFMAVFFVLLFARHFLQVKKYIPQVDKFLLVLLGCCALLAPGSLFIPFTAANKLAVTVVLLTAALLIPVVVAMWRKGHQPARYLLFAWTALAVGTVTASLRSFGLLPDSFVTLYGVQIGSALEVILLSLALASQVSRLRKVAATDALTALYNRRYFFELGELELERARRYSYPLSLIIMDIDHFKKINDQYGHTVGDQVLVVIAHRCREATRKVDAICRYGGDEFSILLPGTDLWEAQKAAERLRTSIASQPINTQEHGAIFLTASLGVATLRNEMSFNDLFREADAALYVAKRSGRNRVAAKQDEGTHP
jgi:diguanylate cyclase (GGDEF)-like protein